MEPVYELLHQAWVEPDSLGRLLEERGQFGVVPVAGRSVVGYPVLDEKLVRRRDRPGHCGRASRIVLERDSEVLEVQEGAYLRRFGLHENAGYLRRAAHGGVQRVQVFQHAAAPGEQVADAEFRLDAGRGVSQRNRHRDHDDDVGRGPAGDLSSEELGHRLDAGQRPGYLARRPQGSSRLSPPVYDSPSGGEQRQHHYEAQSHAHPRDDAEVADYLDGGEQAHQQADDGRYGGQRQRDGDVSQSYADGFRHVVALAALFAVVRDRLDGVVHGETYDDYRRHGRQGVRGADDTQSVGPKPALRADNPYHRSDQPREREQQV